MNPLREDYPIWHPFSQMKTSGELPKIVRAEGVWLHTEDHRRIFDAISSWWVNLHGHSHPHIADRVYAQMLQLEHVIFAGFTHDPALELCNRLAKYLPLDDPRFFFSDNGSTAIEVALKMAVQYLRRTQQSAPVRIIAFEGAYHGDTFGAMSAGERNVFSEPWNDMLFDVVHIPPPTAGCENQSLAALKKALDQNAVFIYEPLIQGAAGMRMHPAEGLNALLHEARQANALLIADEVMTGFMRTGTWFASEQLHTQPDLICLSKGLTGGALPMGLTVCQKFLYDAFLDDRFEKGFLHGHSFTGNPVGCAAALASIDLLEAPETTTLINGLMQRYRQHLPMLTDCKALVNVRTCGTIIAADVCEPADGYLHPLRDQLYQRALKEGVLLRPLGNTLYLLPPYPTPLELIDRTLALFCRLAEEQQLVPNAPGR